MTIGEPSSEITERAPLTLILPKTLKTTLETVSCPWAGTLIESEVSGSKTGPPSRISGKSISRTEV